MPTVWPELRQSTAKPSTNQEQAMHYVAKVAAIAIIAVIVAKRLPVVKDYL